MLNAPPKSDNATHGHGSREWSRPWWPSCAIVGWEEGYCCGEVDAAWAVFWVFLTFSGGQDDLRILAVMSVGVVGDEARRDG